MAPFTDGRRRSRTLARAQEAAFAEPWRLTDAPEDYLRKMIAAIVGVELKVTQLIGKWKLSQNRSTEDIAGVRDDLLTGDETQRLVAAAMQEELDRSGR